MAAEQKKLPKAKHFHLSGKDREYFTGNLALLLKAGVPVSDALQSLQDTSRSKNLKAALQQIQNDIEEGMPLWKALERSGTVGSQTLALVQLGEESGKLVDNLEIAAKQEEKQRIFKSKVRSALLYPTFVITLTLVVGLAIAWFLLPKLAVTFDQLNVPLPFISQIFINFGLFLKENGYWAIPTAIALLILALYILFGLRATKWMGQSLLFHLPGISKLMREVEIARFGYLLGTLLEAGLPVTESLRLLERASTARDYQKFYAYLYKAFEDGYSFKASMGRYKHAATLIPPAVQQMVVAGEKSGALADTLASIGKIYEEKADVSTQNLEAILEPILLVIVWLGVMAVAIAVILPIYSLVGGLEGK